MVERERVLVSYRVDVPVHTPADLLLVEPPEVLASGLSLQVDGVTVPLTLSSAHQGRAGHIHVARATLQAELVSAPHDLELSIGNYPDLPSYFTWSFAIGRDVDVRSSSLARVVDGERRVWERRRLVGDEWRVIRLSTAPDDAIGGRLWRALTPDAPRARPLARALPGTGPLSGGAPSGAFFLAALGLSTATGAGSGVAAGRGAPTAVHAALGAVAAALALALGALGPALVALTCFGAAWLLGRLVAASPRRRPVNWSR